MESGSRQRFDALIVFAEHVEFNISSLILMADISDTSKPSIFYVLNFLHANFWDKRMLILFLRDKLISSGIFTDLMESFSVQRMT